MIRRLILSLIVCSAALLAQANPDWHRAIPGFNIAGNLYYVGTADLAAYLIATPRATFSSTLISKKTYQLSAQVSKSSASNTATPKSS